jgi:hypothetical protein
MTKRRRRLYSHTILLLLLSLCSTLVESQVPTFDAEDATKRLAKKKNEEDFMLWCKEALGIETLLEITTFEYLNYMKVYEEDWEDEDDDKPVSVASDFPLIPVRGMAASRDIAEGEVVIRIPLQALLSVTTTIDQDPVLSRVMGPRARQEYGWNLDADDWLELPLLAVALLHHKKLGVSSPLLPYMRVLDATPVDSMPFLWSNSRLRNVSEGIRTVARGVQREIQDMYDTVVRVLLEDHPELLREEDFSYSKFSWAFAILNSRHWQLPITDMQTIEQQQRYNDLLTSPTPAEDVEEIQPPADMPTEQWVRDQAPRSTANSPGEDDDVGPRRISHNFLAPVADLLNFGPPCTRGSYNEESHTFEIVASCNFKKGQEVTFWYSDECDHIIVGLYGFMHPIVPPCPSAEDYRRSSEEWRAKAEDLQEQLDNALGILDNCDCKKNGLVRGGGTQNDYNNLERHGAIRKMRRERNSEF